MWTLYNRNGEWLGCYDKLEAAMSILGTGDIGLRWHPISNDQYIATSHGGAIRFALVREQRT